MPTLSNLRAVREQQALSQSELAALVDMHQPALSQIERGVRSAQPRTLRKLARALNVKPAELIGDRAPAG
jgi:transcriptional regulator with XRE-family HTH domain